MKKVLIILGIVLICAAIITIILVRPAAIVKDPQNYEIIRVVYDGEDITDKIETNKLVSVISKYTRSRVPKLLDSYQQSLVKIEVNGIVNHKPLHILLGDINIAYSSADKGGYEIHDCEQLLNDVLEVIQ